ncbi:hypothetical protein [Pelagibius marinus]|uniref:hypothetical protein n=1 Tax=Pelagibius marinus TaxID=2762760 RepID=UPI001872A366|nr:hypothetical protein [Pelagibius marinus]
MIAFSSRFDVLRSRFLRRSGLLFGLAAGLLLAGCASEPETRPCPEVRVLTDAARQVKFSGQGRDLTDVLFEASIETGRLVCEYDDNVLDVDLQVQVIGSRGPANSDRLANISYFVAVARTDQTILARQSFDIAIPFPGNRTRVSGLEEIGQVITLQGNEDGGDYLIYVGLDLTREELDYNRANY